MSFLFGNRSSKTFKPKKNIPEGSHQYELLKHAEATLGSGNLRMAVMLPDGEDLNEWVAVNNPSCLYRSPSLSRETLCPLQNY
ncbi:MOB kinase activator 1B-like isoform X3 [Sinocyclocheilus anshuiensis]|uniref:MOB kinase activator 1B-like isoform X3 n=1 Tax=Sinocyclocheilus anshuiensis TaxID=1608454 RepID=UPI0007B9517D|nr:PREDICTED: MOB kinase activator 1B-like isoform X3 [Sinocyclocheilus anshuiensis]